MNIITVGAHSLDGKTSFERTHLVSHLYMHWSFDRTHFRNDITLLRLSTPVILSAQVNTVCLPKAGSRIPTGTKCYLTGMLNILIRKFLNSTIDLDALRILSA